MPRGVVKPPGILLGVRQGDMGVGRVLKKKYVNQKMKKCKKYGLERFPKAVVTWKLRLGAGNILLSPRVLKVRLGIVIGIQPGAAGDRNVGPIPGKLKKLLVRA